MNRLANIFLAHLFILFILSGCVAATPPRAPTTAPVSPAATPRNAAAAPTVTPVSPVVSSAIPTRANRETTSIPVTPAAPPAAIPETATGTAIPTATPAATAVLDAGQTLPACKAASLLATSAEVQRATSALSGTVFITGRRAMPPCIVQGTPRIEILDANGRVLPVEQVAAPGVGQVALPVVLGSADQPNPAGVSIIWRNFCQNPIPPAPYSLRITLPDGDTLPLMPPLAALGAQGRAVEPGLPHCDAPSAPSTLTAEPLRIFVRGKP